MFRKRLALPTLLGLAIALCLAAANPTFAQATDDKQCMELNFSPDPIPNCCGTLITFEPGRAVTCLQVVTDGRGGQHILVSLEAQSQGVDEDGNHYVAVIDLHTNQLFPEIDDHSAQELTIGPFSERIISSGPGPDDQCHALLHITVDANGRLTSGFLTNTPDCQCVPPL
jgi:hypothetical protein